MLNVKLEIGAEVVLQCRECDNAEFKVQLEPSYTDPALAKQLGSSPRVVKYCPFCGGREIEEV